MTSVRPSAVAGLFYPDAPAELRHTVDALLAAAESRRAASSASSARPKALIVPHAGYVYSGPVAATAYEHLRATLDDGPPITRVVLLGPAHRVWCSGLADAEVDFFDTPLGSVPVDREALEALPGRTAGRRAHAPEHSLEVQLPFLQRVLPEAKIVPLLLGDSPPHVVARGLQHLWGGPETLVLVSSDLSHYLPSHTAREVDRATASHIVAHGGPGLSGDQACGCAGINGLLAFGEGRGWRIECLDLRNSGDTSGRSSDGVVGYGAFAVYPPPGSS